LSFSPLDILGSIAVRGNGIKNRYRGWCGCKSR